MRVKDHILEVEEEFPIVRELMSWQKFRIKYFKPSHLNHDLIADTFIKAIASQFDIEESLIFMEDKTTNLTKFRHVVWYLIAKYFKDYYSLYDMAKIFNRNSHVSVIAGIERISSDYLRYGDTRNLVLTCEQLLLNEGIINQIKPYYEYKRRKQVRPRTPKT